jgi:hypothetical protein
MKNRIKLFLTFFIIGITFSNLSAEQGDLHEELYKITSLENGLFENIHPYVDDSAAEDFGVDNFNFEQEILDEVVLQADIAIGDRCPFCGLGSILEDGTCSECERSVIDGGYSLITGSPIKDNWGMILFLSVFYILILAFRRLVTFRKL